MVALVKRLVLAGLRWEREVDNQDNIGVAGIEFALSLGIAVVISGLFS